MKIAEQFKFYDHIIERDIDVIVMQEMLVSQSFADIFLKYANDEGGKVVSVGHSKANSDGESDITMLYQIGNIRKALLIEDKITHKYQPNQHERYNLRGEDGIRNGEYEDFSIILTCPEWYTKKYGDGGFENIVYYDELKKYFDSKSDKLSKIKSRMLELAIDKSHDKNENITKINSTQSRFLEKYIAFADQYKSSGKTIKLLTNNIGISRPGEPKFLVNYQSSRIWIAHKVSLKGKTSDQKLGNVTLLFRGTNIKNHVHELVLLLNNIVGDYRDEGIGIKISKSSIMLTIDTPAIDFDSDFDSQRQALEKCFDIVYYWTELFEKFDKQDIAKLFRDSY